MRCFARLASLFSDLKMRNFLLLALLALTIGEVSGSLQIGVAETSTPSAIEILQPRAAAPDGQFMFAAAAAIFMVVLVIAIMQYAR